MLRGSCGGELANKRIQPTQSSCVDTYILLYATFAQASSVTHMRTTEHVATKSAGSAFFEEHELVMLPPVPRAAALQVIAHFENEDREEARHSDSTFNQHGGVPFHRVAVFN